LVRAIHESPLLFIGKGFATIRFVQIVHNNECLFAVEEDTQYALLGRDENGQLQPHDTLIPKNEAKLIAPVTPSKIIAVGLNYRSHAKELDMLIPDNPILFLKPLTALAGPFDKIQYPVASQQVDFEGELALVIGAKGRCIPEEKAKEYIMGYTLANDITARDLQKKDGQWTRAKGFDGFCPVGPCVRTGIEDPETLEFKTYLNGEERQHGKVSDFIFTIPQIIAFVSEVMTLLPGDIILTGTPPGIGPVQPGDTVRIECEPIGVLENTFVKY
jgi:2-keto-4-pentenoate hydratase/2-oxohepta-3-ene-1,7-dioic acid hydratase in catechol pathway